MSQFFIAVVLFLLTMLVIALVAERVEAAAEHEFKSFVVGLTIALTSMWSGFALTGSAGIDFSNFSSAHLEWWVLLIPVYLYVSIQIYKALKAFAHNRPKVYSIIAGILGIFVVVEMVAVSLWVIS